MATESATTVSWPTIYGVITGTIGTICGVIALYRTIRNDHINLRIESRVGESVEANGQDFSITIFNDGRDIVINSISAIIYGELSVEIQSIMSKSFEKNRQWRSKRKDYNPFPSSISRHDRFEYLNQPYPWADLAQANKSWCVEIELSSGNKVQIPSWRLPHTGPTTVRSKFLRSNSVKVSYGSKAFETEIAHRRVREQSVATAD